MASGLAHGLGRTVYISVGMADSHRAVGTYAGGPSVDRVGRTRLEALGLTERR